MSYKSYLASFVLLILPSVSFAAGPRIAVWDAEHGTTESRITISLPAQKRIAAWLNEGGASATPVTAGQIADPAVFSARQFDAVIFLGGCFPRSDIAALKQFADDGGVLVCLGADVPFLIAIEPEKDGQWALSPKEPKFSWQDTELLSHIGLKYLFKPELHDQGITHSATALLNQYLPDVREVRGKFASRWVIAQTDKGQHGEIFPLLRSRRRDQQDVPSQLYVVRNGKRHAIISASDFYTSESRSDLWPLGRQTLLALAHLAQDLHDGKDILKPDTLMHVNPDQAPMPSVPLGRAAAAAIEPEHAHALIRWGAFDGSGYEFGPALADGTKATLPSGATAQQFPASLGAGAALQLPLPKFESGPLYLRIRGAYTATGAALKASLGEQVVLNESFVYIDSSSPGNFDRNLSGVAAEFTRIVYLPPTSSAASTLILSNPGKFPIYFDALQIERPTQPARERIIGLGSGASANYSRELAKTWSSLRMSLRTNFLGAPDDPKRFAKMDELFNRTAAMNSHLEPILEGTPPWAAISPERLEEAQKAKRPHTVPPDPAKYARIVQDVIERYGSRISVYEMWNEADITQFYRGTTDEYITLCKTILPVIRQYAPNAKVMMTGMSGFRPEFLRKTSESGLLKQVDLIPCHPYAGKSAAWDMKYSMIEGELMSLGIDTEIFCNESGFPYANIEWFQAPPVFTPQTQHDLLDVAMARLLASGLAKLSVFNAGGDGNEYGLFDRKGNLTPAYQVFSDYVPLGQPGGRRLDVSLTSADGAPLQGVYAAATSYPDGSAAIVINPADNEAMHPIQPPVIEQIGGEKWTCFFGAAKYASGKATITPAPDKKSAGYYKTVSVDRDRFPIVEVEASGDKCDWELLFKTADGVATAIAPRQGAGTLRVDYREMLKQGGNAPVEVSFRIYSPTTFSAVRFLPASEVVQPIEKVTIPVRVCLPLSKPLAPIAILKAGKTESQATVTLHAAEGANWAEIIIPLQQRTTVQLRATN